MTPTKYAVLGLVIFAAVTCGVVAGTRLATPAEPEIVYEAKEESTSVNVPASDEAATLAKYKEDGWEFSQKVPVAANRTVTLFFRRTIQVRR